MFELVGGYGYPILFMPLARTWPVKDAPKTYNSKQCGCRSILEHLRARAGLISFGSVGVSKCFIEMEHMIPRLRGQ